MRLFQTIAQIIIATSVVNCLPVQPLVVGPSDAGRLNSRGPIDPPVKADAKNARPELAKLKIPVWQPPSPPAIPHPQPRPPPGQLQDSVKPPVQPSGSSAGPAKPPVPFPPGHAFAPSGLIRPPRPPPAPKGKSGRPSAQPSAPKKGQLRVMNPDPNTPLGVGTPVDPVLPAAMPLKPAPEFMDKGKGKSVRPSAQPSAPKKGQLRVMNPDTNTPLSGGTPVDPVLPAQDQRPAAMSLQPAPGSMGKGKDKGNVVPIGPSGEGTLQPPAPAPQGKLSVAPANVQPPVPPKKPGTGVPIKDWLAKNPRPPSRRSSAVERANPPPDRRSLPDPPKIPTSETSGNDVISRRLSKLADEELRFRFMSLLARRAIESLDY
jgi:hypothetical protein